MSTLSEIISATTRTKVVEFSRVKDRILATYSSLLAQAAAKPELIDKLVVLYDGLKDISVAQTSFHADMKEIGNVVESLREDPTTSPEQLQFWIDKLMSQIEQGKKRCQYAHTYGRIIDEHATHLNTRRLANTRVALLPNPRGSASELEDVGAPDDTVILSKILVEREQTKADFKKLVFSVAEDTATNSDALYADYLRTVFAFSDAPLQEKFDAAVREVNRCGEFYLTQKITALDISTTISGLLEQDLLNDVRQASLREIKNDALFHSEIASILNITLTGLSTWSWPSDGVLVDFRRQLNGKHRAYMDEDMMTALFLQLVGEKWASVFEKFFSTLRTSHVWNTDETVAWLQSRGFSENLNRNRSKRTNKSIADCRRSLEEELFMTCLNSEMNYGDADTDAGSESEKKANPVELKQKLIHMISVEAKLAAVLSPASPFTVVRTDFAWYGPSIHHKRLLQTLEFFGVPTEWLSFFQRFLEAPLLFDDNNIPSKRTRGIPISHFLSSVFGEVMLFPLDFNIKRKTDLNLFRLYDDVWFFGQEQKAVLQAWDIVNEFCAHTSLSLNLEKSGSAVLNTVKDSTPQVLFGPEPLPQQPITWGFLTMQSDGSFFIAGVEGSQPPSYQPTKSLQPASSTPEQQPFSLDTHIAEFRARLLGASTVLAWVNIYNRYTKFFLRNFGSAVYVWGSAHASRILAALKYIHQKIFPETCGSPVKALRNLLASRGILSEKSAHGDAWAYFPLSVGGLELFNPALEVLRLLVTLREIDKDAAKDSVLNRLRAGFEHLLEDDEKRYREAKHEWRKEQKRKERGDVRKLDYESDDDVSDDDGLQPKNEAASTSTATFPSFEKWSARRLHSPAFGTWARRYDHLLQKPTPSRLTFSSAISAKSLELPPRNLIEGMVLEMSAECANMDVYWNLVLAVYGEQVLSEFGTLRLVSQDIVPFGMVKVLKREKIDWET